MRKMGITALATQPGTSQPNPQHKVFSYLLRKLTINRSIQVWALDTTYIRMARGFVYLTAVADVYSRCILAHRTAITLEAVTQSMLLKKPIDALVSPRLSTQTKAAS